MELVGAIKILDGLFLGDEFASQVFIKEKNLKIDYIITEGIYLKNNN